MSDDRSWQRNCRRWGVPMLNTQEPYPGTSTRLAVPGAGTRLAVGCCSASAAKWLTWFRFSRPRPLTGGFRCGRGGFRHLPEASTAVTKLRPRPRRPNSWGIHHSAAVAKPRRPRRRLISGGIRLRFRERKLRDGGRSFDPASEAFETEAEASERLRRGFFNRCAPRRRFQRGEAGSAEVSSTDAPPGTGALRNQEPETRPRGGDDRKWAARRPALAAMTWWSAFGASGRQDHARKTTGNGLLDPARAATAGQ